MAYIIGLVNPKELADLTASTQKLEVEILSDEKITGLLGEGWDEGSIPGETWVMIPADVDVTQIMFGADWNTISRHSGEET